MYPIYYPPYSYIYYPPIFYLTLFLIAQDDGTDIEFRNVGFFYFERRGNSQKNTDYMVYPALLPLMRTPRLPVVDWTDAPAELNGLVRFAEKTKSGFCAYAITFQMQSNAFIQRLLKLLLSHPLPIPLQNMDYDRLARKVF